MPTENVTIPIKLDDQFKRNMQDFLRVMRAIQEESGMRTRERFKGFEELHGRFQKMGRDLKGTITPGLTALGISVLSLGGAIAAVVGSVKDFTESITKLSQASKAAGVAAADMRVWEGVGARFHISTDEVASGFVNFADKMAGMRQHTGDLYRALSGQIYLQDFSRDLQATTNNMDAFRITIKKVMEMKRPSDKRAVLAMAGLPQGFANLDEAELEKIVARVRKAQGILGPDWEKRAKEAEEAWLDLKDTWQQIIMMLGSELAPVYRELAKVISDWALTHKKEIHDTIAAFGKWLTDPDGLPAILHDIKAAVGWLDKGAQLLGGWKTLIEAIIAIKVIGFFLNLGSAIRGIARAIGIANAARRARWFGGGGIMSGGLLFGALASVPLLKGLNPYSNYPRDQQKITDEQWEKMSPAERSAARRKYYEEEIDAAKKRTSRPMTWSEYFYDDRSEVKKKLREDTASGVRDALDQIKAENKDRRGKGGAGAPAFLGGLLDGASPSAPSPPPGATMGTAPNAEPSAPPSANDQGANNATVPGTPGTERFGVKAGGVDPRLVSILRETSKYLPSGWTAKLESGYRAGSQGFHSQHVAADVALYDAQGRKVPWYQNPAAFRTYQAFANKAREIQKNMYPGLTGNFRWGGYFSGRLGPGGTYGAMDLMHFDFGPSSAMVAGTWDTGLHESWRRAWGVTAPSQIQMTGDKAPVNPTVAQHVAPPGSPPTNLYLDLKGFPRGVATMAQPGAGVDSITVNRGRVGPDLQPAAR